MAATAHRPAAAVAGASRPADRIVVPVEGTASEFLVQEWAAQLAAALDVPVLALHVIAPARASEDASDAFAYVQAECARWRVALATREVVSGDVTREILGELAPRDLVVIGTRRLGSAFHVGSVAGELVRRAPCPVQIVRIG